MFDLNESEYPWAIAFENDFIIYAANNWPSQIQQTPKHIT